MAAAISGTGPSLAGLGIERDTELVRAYSSDLKVDGSAIGTIGPEGGFDTLDEAVDFARGRDDARRAVAILETEGGFVPVELDGALDEITGRVGHTTTGTGVTANGQVVTTTNTYYVTETQPTSQYAVHDAEQGVAAVLTAEGRSLELGKHVTVDATARSRNGFLGAAIGGTLGLFAGVVTPMGMDMSSRSGGLFGIVKRNPIAAVAAGTVLGTALGAAGGLMAGRQIGS